MAAGADPVVIVGAGIAGLTSALALARAGFEVVVLERAGRLAEVGAGLQLSPNASRILIDLGLKDALAAVAGTPAAIVIRDARSGAGIVRIDLAALAAREAAPYWVIHRADLQAVLLAAVAAEPRIRLHLAVDVRAIHDRAGTPRIDAVIDDVATTLAATAVIGADGVRSWVRSAVFGGGPAAYSGRTAFRATIPADAWTGGLELATTTGLWLGSKAHLVHYPVQAGRAINLVAAIDDGWTAEGWDAPATRADVLSHFQDWPAAVRGLLALPETWRRWALCGAPADSRWSDGAVALIGDAVHGMLPFVAQGGAMAIEDAAVLARHLAADRANPAAALARYGAERAPRTAKVVATARRNAVVYHLGGLAASARNAAMGWLGPAGMARQMDWIWGWRDNA